MSQSPVESTSNDQASSYRQGWAALNQMLHEGKSFSGHERNCAFLNLGGNSFADVSGLIGFNFDEDGRTVVSSDWDFDGDLDLWTTARTAPRLRFLKNNSAAEQKNFLSVRLVGNGVESNRDAVGAIVELYLKNEKTPLIRTVTAGDAFISQNSQWLTFHYSPDQSIRNLFVHWPGGQKQVVDELISKSFYKIHQGKKVEMWRPPFRPIDMKSGLSKANASSEQARIVLTGRLPIVPIHIRDEHSESELPQQWLKGPLLLNLWAPWCQPCVEELSSWTQSEEILQNAGLRIVALNADGSAIDSAERLLRRLRFPFHSAHAKQQTVLNLDWFQRSFLDHWAPLPIPSSFLIDRQGDVAVIYKGPVSPEQILKDMKLLDLNMSERRDAAIPFAGKWLKPTRFPNPLLVNGQFVAHDAISEGTTYLRRYLESVDDKSVASPEHIAKIAHTIGTLLAKSEDPSAAKSYLAKALRFAPDHTGLRIELAELLLSSASLDHIQEAIAILKPDPKVQVTDPASRRLLSQAFFLWGESLKCSRQYPEAEQAFRQSIQLDPTQVKAAEKLAWLFVSQNPDQGQRKSNALAIAERLCAITQRKHAGYLDLLAFIQALHGKFVQAIRTAEEAQTLRADAPDSRAFKEGKNRMDHYHKRLIPDLRSESD